MAVSALTIITQAWVRLGIGSPGDIMPANESSNGLVELNIMIDEFSAARDLVYEILQQLFLLTNAQSFSIGPTATVPFNVARPAKIENAMIRVGGLDHHVDLISQQDWLEIIDKGATGTAPSKLYYDPQVPNAVINLHPIPLCNVATDLILGTWTSINQFATLATTANLPPAYYSLLVSGLAIKLAPTYGSTVDPTVLALRKDDFTEALSAVRALNAAIQMVPVVPTGTPTAQQLAIQQANK